MRDALLPLLVGLLVWSLLMVGIQWGHALTAYVERRRH